MKPALGWTMLSRAEIGAAERALKAGDQDTRDEIGFLLLHQGFADRFFPGTSVLHTRLRYVLFVPWMYESAGVARRRGRDIKGSVEAQMLALARRLKIDGREETGVIGGDLVEENGSGRLSSQPPDVVYWSALRAWNMLSPGVHSARDARRRLEARPARTPRDDDGSPLDQAATDFSVFCRLLPLPFDGWGLGRRVAFPELQENGVVTFELSAEEKDYLREKLGALRRTDGAPALLARLVQADVSFEEDTEDVLPTGIENHADEEDQRALTVARDAAWVASLGRMVYGALVEWLCEKDGVVGGSRFREQLQAFFAAADFRLTAACHCDLAELNRLFPGLPGWFGDVLRRTREYAGNGDWREYTRLLEPYRDAETWRKGRRARLASDGHGKERRLQNWDPSRHNTKPLHYRWEVVHQMLADLQTISA